MRASWSSLPHQLRIAAIAMLAAWTTVLSWRVLTADFAEVAIPLLFIGVVLGAMGAFARWARLPLAAIVLGQFVVGALLVLGTITGSPLPTPANVDTFVSAVQDAVETSRSFAAPVQPGVPPVHPLLLIGGALVVFLVDVIACTLRRAPVSGLVLLTAYTLPVAVTGEAVSWWIFIVVAALFLALVFIQHSDHLASWGRAADDDTGSFSVRTGAIGNTAVALGASAIALAVLLPAAVPTMSMSVFEGNGPGTREVEVKDPMVDLRRDLSRGEDIPLLWVTTPGPKPTYLRYSVLANFNGTTWTPGDREIPSTQSATGALPPLDGVAVSVPRREFKYSIRVGPDFDSTWLPTMPQVTQIAAGTDWRYDVSTRDFIAAQDDVTAAELNYDFTGAQLTYDAESMNSAVSGAGEVPGIFTDVPPSLNNEIRRLAASVTADAPTRFQKAQTLQQWFREDGGFRYDIGQVESAGNGGADLLAFLEDRVGYCEQFAASMAIMARVLGIPSRVAVGFLEPERSTNGSWEYSAHDLHAWPELYFPGSGWVRFEPTPQNRAEQRPGLHSRRVRARPRDVVPQPEPVDRAPPRARPDSGRRRVSRRRGRFLHPLGTGRAGRPGPRPGGAAAARAAPGARCPPPPAPGRRHRGHLGRAARRRRGPRPRLAERPLTAPDRRLGGTPARPARVGPRPARPPPTGPRPGSRGRARTRPADDGARALALLPQPRVLHRRAVPRRRPPRRGVPHRRRQPPCRTPCDLVARVGRGSGSAPPAPRDAA